MRKIFISLTSLMLANSIFAYDASAPHYKGEITLPSWTGPYLGLNAGYGWGSQAVGITGDPVVNTAINAGLIPSQLARNFSSFVGGGQFGYNFQVLTVVIGFETDIQWVNFNSPQSVTHTVPSYPTTTTYAKQDQDYFGTVRGRLGVLPINPLLVYLTGGFAYGDVSLSSSVNSIACAGLCGSASDRNTNIGWTVGAGLEYMIHSNWTAKIEYLYYDLGNLTTVTTDPTFPGLFMRQKVDYKDNIIRLGVNYKFF